MNPVTRIALRRLKRNWRKNLLVAVAITFSMTMIAFFLFFQLQTSLVHNPETDALPFTKFVGTVGACMRITVTVLLITTFLTVRLHCSMQREENAHTRAVLTSIGADGQQKRKLIHVDLLTLYFPPVILGTSLGIIPGIKLGNRFVGVTVTVTDFSQYVLTATGIIAAGIALILLCNFLPEISFKKRSVIGAVKKQNTAASEQRHGYRQSKTFKNQSLLKRLAKKSVDYYSKTYNPIALSFASAAIYPITLLLFFYHIGSTEVVLDTNPYDGIDTASAVLAATDKILLFLGACFLALTCIGLAQAFLMARIQLAARKKSVQIYLSLGMPESDIKKMMFLELRSVLIRAFAFLLFGAIVVNFCFKLAVQ